MFNSGNKTTQSINVVNKHKRLLPVCLCGHLLFNKKICFLVQHMLFHDFAIPAQRIIGFIVYRIAIVLGKYSHQMVRVFERKNTNKKGIFSLLIFHFLKVSVVIDRNLSIQNKFMKTKFRISVFLLEITAH